MGIGKNIKNIIEDRHITVNELATNASINPQTLYAIIKRDKPGQKVSPDILHKLSQALGVSTTELTGGIEILDEGQLTRTPTQIMAGIYGNHVFQGSKEDIELFSDAYNLKLFEEWLKSNRIDFRICKLNGKNGKIFSFNEKEGFKYFLSDEQSAQLSEMSIEQVKALIRSFDQMNKKIDPE